MSAVAELVEEAPGPSTETMRRDLAAWFEVNYGFTPLWLEWLTSGEIDSLEDVVDFSDLDDDPEAAITPASYALDHGVSRGAAAAALHRAARAGTLRRIGYGLYAPMAAGGPQ